MKRVKYDKSSDIHLKRRASRKNRELLFKMMNEEEEMPISQRRKSLRTKEAK